MPTETIEAPKPKASAYRQVIAEKIPLQDGETLSIRRVSERCFRVNVWTEIDLNCPVPDNRIIRSYFVTIRPDEVLIN